VRGAGGSWQERAVSTKDASSAAAPVWLTPAGRQLLAKYGLPTALIAWAASRLLTLWWVGTDDPAAHASLFSTFLPSMGGDVGQFYEWASAWVAGQVPYRDVPIHYPPGAAVLFTIPRLFATTLDGYQTGFALEMLAFEAIGLALLWRLPSLILGRTADEETRSTSVLVVLAYVALSALLGRLTIRRFDAAVGALLVGFVHCALAAKRSFWAELLLALGIWIKLTPAALVPLYFVLLHRREAPAQPFFGWLVRAGWRPAGRIALFFAALVTPFAWSAGGGILQTLRFQADRGLQLESLPASLLVFVQSFHGIGLSRGEAHGAVEVFHSWGPALTLASDIAVIVTLLAIVGVCARRLRGARGPAAEREIFVAGTVASLLAVMGLAKLFSPQYVMWVAALLPLTQLRSVHRSVAAAVGIVFALTGYLYLFDYTELCEMARAPASMLLLRNFAVLWLVWRLCADAGRSTTSEIAGAPAGEANERRARIVAAAIALTVAAWIVVTNLTPLHEGVLWSDLRVGRTILAQHVFPRTDTFTATGAGAPISVPSWLAGVSFYAWLSVAHTWTLCLLQPAVAGACALLLLLSLRREERGSAAVVPFLLLAMHVVASRTDVRHQMFSPLGLAALGCGLERWRRSGRVRDLAWLVPLQVLRANLNGEALAAPLLVGLLALVIAVGARWRRVSDEAVEAAGRAAAAGGAEDRPLGPRDARVLGGVAVMLFLATLCNPYGVDRALWFPGWEDGDGQWSLASAAIHQYPTWTSAALALALWIALTLRWRSGPAIHLAIDLAIAAFATFMSVRAFRFLPYVAILGFPILVRSTRDLSARFLAGPPPRRWLGLELGVALALLAVGAANGYSFSPWINRPLGVGVTRALPFAEVQLLKSAGAQGAIFNDRAAGGVISFDLAPNVRPVIDAHADARGSARWAEYQRARKSRDEFLAYLDKYDVKFVLLHVDAANVPMLRTLAAHPGWTLAHDSPTYGLYVRTARP
jgi:hypothetical protein